MYVRCLYRFSHVCGKVYLNLLVSVIFCGKKVSECSDLGEQFITLAQKCQGSGYKFYQGLTT